MFLFYVYDRYHSATGAVVILCLIYVAFVFGVFAGCLSASRAVSVLHILFHIICHILLQSTRNDSTGNQESVSNFTLHI